MELGLCLAGGGVKGAAHIGVLKVFEEENIKIKYISGASSGSIVATLHACGYKSDEIYELFKKYAGDIKYIDFKSVLKIINGLITKRKIIINGLNSGETLEKIITEACAEKGIKNINQIEMPLLIPSVSLHTGGVYIFSSRQVRREISDNSTYITDADIGIAVRASSSYPALFSPCEYKNLELVDGGLRENVPWRELREFGADKVISIVFDEGLSDKPHTNMIDVVSSSLRILKHDILKCETEGSGMLIKIKTGRISLLDTKKIDELYKLGYETAKSKVREIKNMIGKF